jgi:hypothetical protein
MSISVAENVACECVGLGGATGSVLLMTLSERSLDVPVVGRCAICAELGWLEPIVRVEGRDLTVCSSCSATAEHFSRFAQGRPLLVLRSERG